MVTTTNRDIRKLKLEELEGILCPTGVIRPFAPSRSMNGFGKSRPKTLTQMTNLSLATRELLKQHFVINHIHVDNMQRSADGTIKNAVKLHDGLIVESVLIPAEKRITACVFSR